MKPNVAIYLLLSLLILVFALTGISKWVGPGGAWTRMLWLSGNAKGAAVLETVVPLAELGIVLLLVFALTRLQMVGVLAGMVLLIAVYLVVFVILPAEGPCECMNWYRVM